MTLAENIKKLRKQRGWTQKKLSEKIGAHVAHINRIEKGKYKPSTDGLLKLADVFSVSVESLLAEEEQDFQEVKIEDKSLAQRIKLIDTLKPEDRQALIQVIDAMLTRDKIARLISNGDKSNDPSS